VGAAEAGERQRGLEEREREQVAQGDAAGLAGTLEELARWRSAAGKGATAYLNALPGAVTDKHAHFPPEEFRETLRRGLGIEREAPGGHCSNCKAAQSGAHIRRCAQGLNSDRHHKVVLALVELLRSEGRLIGVRREYSLCFQPEHRASDHSKQMDLWFPAGQLDTPVPTVQPSQGAIAAGKCSKLIGGYQVAVCLDYTLRDGTCRTYRAAASRDVVQGLIEASVIKVKTYVESGAINPATTTLISLAFDQFGTASPDTHAFFRRLAVHQAQQSGGLYSVAHCVARWRQKLSTLLQRTTSKQVVDAWYCTRAVAQQPPPAIRAFRQLYLLSPPSARAPSAPPAAPGALPPASFTPP
jgi:hypothetical protein